MRKIIAALALLAVAPSARAEPTGGFIACPLNSPVNGSDANGSCIRVNIGSGLTFTAGSSGSPGTLSSSGGAVTSSALDTLLGATQGGVATRNATVWTGLAPGTAGQVLTSGGAGANLSWGTVATGNITITHTYTAAGAIAITDSFSAFNSASPLSMTLAAGTVDGHQISLEDYGAGAITVALSYYGTSTTITLNQTGIRNLFWNAATSTYRNAS